MGFSYIWDKSSKIQFYITSFTFFLCVLLAHAGNLERDHGKERESERGRTRMSTISQCVNKLLFIDFQGETLLTCPALNGRHLLLALRPLLLK